MLVEFTDGYHQAKEERVLLPVLEVAWPNWAGHLARRLKGDHAVFCKLVAIMR